jgi:outer membrane receptor protein involved in Fe transport
MINIRKPLRLAALGAAIGMCIVSTAYAQSNTTGSIFGVAPTEPGTTIIIQNLDTGQTRTLTTDKAGKYRASSLQSGRYKVTLQKDGADISVREEVAVIIASGTEVSFVNASGIQELEGVVVTATAAPQIDVSQVDTRTVFTAETLSKIAVPRDIASVALLAPGVVRNDSYTDSSGVTIPSFGGGASSENAYYINGYPVTNPLTSIGFTALPFEAISQEQVLTGGFGAEFGRSTGGVINIVTKRGSNEWKAGVYTIWSPESLRASPRNRYYPDTGFYGPDRADPRDRTDGTLDLYRNQNQSWNNTTGAYVGGAIIPDRLFIYANAELSRQEGTSVQTTRLGTTPATQGAYLDFKRDKPRWSAKVDWNITDNHVLEFTGVSDVTKFKSTGYAFDYSDFSHGSEQNSGSNTEDDSKLYIAKYTGYLTDDLTVSALYGRQKIDHSDSPWGYDPNCPRISGLAGQYPGIGSAGCQTALEERVPGEYDETKGGRFDVSYRIGDHELRAGYDRNDASSFTGSAYAGGFVWVYTRTANPNAPINPSYGVGSPAQGGGFGPEGYYVRKQYYTGSGTVETKQQAYYLEDRWQISDNVLLSLGLRNDNFKNYTGSGEVYVKQSDQWAPRIGAVWDVNGDATLKVYGNAGRYHLALPNNVATRAANGSLYTLEYFTYTGIDPVTGAPTGLVNIPVDPNTPYTCPGNAYAVAPNLECGDAPDPRTVAAVGLKSHYQDEFIIGLEQAFNADYSWGAKFTHRELKSAIDDTCTPALGGGCFIFNPGVGNTFWEEQEDGSFEQHHYSAEELNLPKLKRKYIALDFFLERQFSDNWYGKVQYTWSKNYGNTEGQLASDLDTGNGGQTDVSVTQDWDLPQLMDGANGYLPNHRAHQLKFFGYYQFTKEWTTGGSLIAASGRPRNCTSYYPTPDAGLYNGSYYYYCGLAGSGTAAGSTGYVAPSADYRRSPRGSAGTTPWTYQLNLNVAYQPDWADNKLTLQVDIFNVLNRQVPGTYNSQYAVSRVEASQNYGKELGYSQPRSFRLTARYDF